jgi:hypothetical protein
MTLELDPPTVKATTVSPVYKYAFLAVFLITLLAFGVYIWLSVEYSKPSDAIKKVTDTCDFILKAGFGAMVGLIGGKAL